MTTVPLTHVPRVNDDATYEVANYEKIQGLAGAFLGLENQYIQ